MIFSSNNLRPIGVFDSGIGGLSVLKEVHHLLPHEDLIYVADSAHAPYGDRSASYVQNRSQKIAEFLINHDVKAIVIACNTATAEAAEPLRKILDVPIIGLEPAIKPAAKLSKSGIIGVLATYRTIHSKRLSDLTVRYAKNKQILKQACPGLVEQVESCALSDKATEALLKQYISPLLERGADTLILGCTHYPFLLPIIRNIVGDQIQIIETGKPVAKQLKRILIKKNLQKNSLTSTNNLDYKTHLSFYNSSSNIQKYFIMKKLWKKACMTASEDDIKILPLPKLK